MSDIAKYNEMFEYLSASELPTGAESTVVFGRKDPLVAYAIGDLVVPGLVETVVITGGLGKDSGDILEQGYRSEAHYLDDQLRADAARRGYALPEVILEEAASNGGENARNSLDKLSERGARVDSMTAVAHATSARRLAETLKFNAGKKTGVVPVVYRAPSAYAFDPTNPADRDEAAAELLRLVQWPAKGWLGPQEDLPANLVDFAQERHGNPPKPVSPFQSAVLRRLPAGVRSSVIDLAARYSRR